MNAFTGDTVNGQPATSANATIALAAGAVLPAGLSLDPATGYVSVAPGTAQGRYNFDYQLCERLNPANCAVATISITILPPRSAVTGVVWLDANMNRTPEGSEPHQQDWIVEVVRDGAVVGTARTDARGSYTVADLLSGGGYTIRFRHPVSGAIYGRIEGAVLPVDGTLANQNMPIDPSGVIYDAITRAPIAGARVTLTDANGAALPVSCYLDPAQAGQVTGADGYYRFDIITGAAPQCPSARTEYRLQVMAPTGYADPISTVIAAQSGALNVGGLSNPAGVVPGPGAPKIGDPTLYYLAFRIAAGDAHVVNNHIPLDPFLNRAPLLVTKTSEKRTASTGDLVPYTIIVRNNESAARVAVDVVDILPPGSICPRFGRAVMACRWSRRSPTASCAGRGRRSRATPPPPIRSSLSSAQGFARATASTRRSPAARSAAATFRTGHRPWYQLSPAQSSIVRRSSARSSTTATATAIRMRANPASPPPASRR
ncbi:MAG: DUF11 domain-containing protein [Sphingopyxis sp.]|nr:DUF11 domain-containing protein [Sphingopyxis sp.]